MLHSANPTQTAGPAASPVSTAKPALDLQVRLDKCVRQLSDWRGCPSGKTPQGKQIIESLEAQIRNLQSQISSAEHSVTGPTAPSKPLSSAFAAAQAGAKATASNPVLSTCGSLVNVFA